MSTCEAWSCGDLLVTTKFRLPGDGREVDVITTEFINCEVAYLWTSCYNFPLV